MILSRPEAKQYLEITPSFLETEVTDFEITRLSKDQYQDFAQKFPFKSNQKEKGEELIQKCKQNPSFGKQMEVPMTAVINCALFDDPKLSKDLKDQSDLFRGLTAMNIKYDEVKQIDLQIEGSSEKKDQLIKEKNNVLKLDAEDILKLYRRKLIALGRGIFKCNGNSFVGFNDCNRKTLEESLSSEGIR